jgi:UDP-N-acetylglucosamine 1-carboxyvinyltransferase
MAKLRVNGGRRLVGGVTPSANKNAVLPVLCATLLTNDLVTLRNVPDITDVRKILDYFRSIGSTVEADFDTGVIRLQHGVDLDARTARLPSGMRSTIMLIPALMRRFGGVVLEDDSKGCTLGMREIDPHVEVLRAFGATITARPEGVLIEAPVQFQPASHWQDYASVTTTENFMMCAVLAPGRSRLVNAACEPHVQEFGRFLILMGAEIEGVGASTVVIDGGKPLGGAEYAFVDDFHEVATFLALAAITGGEVRVRNGAQDQFQLLDRTFAKFGVTVAHQDGWSTVVSRGPLRVQRPFTAHMMQKVEAAPWPYVPADLLPIYIALGARAEGSVMFWNKVYEGALGWTSELTKFGVQVVACDPHRIITFGGQPLTAAVVESPYIIRAAIALLMVAVSIEGPSVIDNADPIRRAHPNFVENLQALGADIRWE